MKRILYLYVIVLIVSLVGCISPQGLKGNGLIEKRAFAVRDFENIILTGSIQAEIVQGNEYKTEIELDSNLYEALNIAVSDDTLRIGFKESVRKHSAYKIYIQAPNIRHICKTGSGSMVISGVTDTQAEMRIEHIGSGSTFVNAVVKKLYLIMKGSGSTFVNAVVKKLYLIMKGSGSITAKGSAETVIAEDVGSGVFMLFDLKADDVIVSCRGSGKVEVTAEKSLDAVLKGSGNVRYRGNPSKIRLRASGSGTVQKDE